MGVFLGMVYSLQANPEGPCIQLLGNLAPIDHTIEGIMGPNSLMVVYVSPGGIEGPEARK